MRQCGFCQSVFQILSDKRCDYQTVIKNNSGRFQLNNASINTENSEYGTALYGDKIVFAGATDARKAKRGVSQWTGESFYDLYEAEHFDQKLGSRKPFSSSINTQFNESTPVFTKDGNTMYFTRNNYVNRKLGSDMADSVTGGGLHGKDLSKADVSVNIYAFLRAQQLQSPVEFSCAIGDENIGDMPYEEIVRIAKEYIDSVGGFEKFAEWGLF